ncbi:genetic suppressor element 1-like [Osmerus mordax]|uniref:genetic suppressor element 1-like n=1 Tax=Osmerus mordax TaxID=8014 RepID=UPI0035109553
MVRRVISTATRTTATLSPLANGSADFQSAGSGFAAALQKLAKQTEPKQTEPKQTEPRDDVVEAPVIWPALQSSRGGVPPLLPSLVPSHLGRGLVAGGVPGTLAAGVMSRGANKEGLTRAEGVLGRGSLQPSAWSRAQHQDGSLEGLCPQRPWRLPLSPRACSHLGVRSPATSPSPPRELQDAKLACDEALRQPRRLISTMDLRERRKREASEGGYYYDLDYSCDESDEEDVKAHLKRVSEQPPLKLDTSSEKVDFLRGCGLTTQAHRNQLLHQQRRKRRRMLKERSPSPPAPPLVPPPPLTTPHTPEEMDRCPKLEDKKKFLSGLHLSHISSKRRRSHRTEDTRLAKGPPAKTLQGLQDTVDSPAQLKRAECGQKWHGGSWERFPPEVFAQHFQQLSSRGELHSNRRTLSLQLNTPTLHKQTTGGQNYLSEEEDEEESGRWQGIEAIFEAYHEYMDERGVERQVLLSQCRRLEAEQVALGRTAQQLSLTMGELISQQQRVGEERGRLQAQLQHFRNCLTLPNIDWGRRQANGHTSR